MYNLDNNKPEWEHKHARHRAMGYVVDEGKLWKVVDGKSIQARAHQECVSQEEAMVMAAKKHRENGHWG